MSLEVPAYDWRRDTHGAWVLFVDAVALGRVLPHHGGYVTVAEGHRTLYMFATLPEAQRYLERYARAERAAAHAWQAVMYGEGALPLREWEDVDASWRPKRLSLHGLVPPSPRAVDEPAREEHDHV